MTGPRALKLGAVSDAPVGGVKLPRHALTKETERLIGLTGRIARRLVWAERLMVEGQLPDEEWRELYEVYGKTLTNLLKEQRERSKLLKGSGLPPLTDEETAEELELLAKETLRTLSGPELAQMLSERNAIDVEPVEGHLAPTEAPTSPSALTGMVADEMSAHGLVNPHETPSEPTYDDLLDFENK